VSESITLNRRNEGVLLKRAQALLATARDKHAFLKDAGSYMVHTVIPRRFDTGGPGWAPVKRGGSPLIDKGLMRQKNDFTVWGETLTIGNFAPQSRLQNRGGPLAGQRPGRRKETLAREDLNRTLGTKYEAKKSVGWMYVRKRPFIYWGQALADIARRWTERMKRAS
jgi:hypothetical protein